MTLESAKREAQRRADVLGNSYIVARRKGNDNPNGYMVVLSLPNRCETIGERIYPTVNDLRTVSSTPSRDTLRLDENGSGFDYDRQAWVINGRYVACGHPESMACDCYGRLHQGEQAE